MELSPRLYKWLVRPEWFPELCIGNVLKSRFDFNNKTVLDFGSGVGTNCSMFKPSNYIGIDCNLKRVRYAKYLYPNYNFDVIKDSHVPLPGNSVDYVIVVSVLHHITPDELTSYLYEFRRVLKPNGSVICYRTLLLNRFRI